MPESTDQKKASIPSWQRQSQPQERTEPEPKPDEPPKEGPPPARAALLEQASRFLQEDEIREASTDRKIAFLESKGLTNEEISNLLGVSRNTAASSSSSPAQEPKTMDSQDNPPRPQSSPSPSHPPPPPSSPPQHQTQPRPPTTNPIPPIITYPEFLLHSHPPKPAPLLTPHRLLTTLYLSSALAASLYGLSKTVLAPMTSALTAARHDLAATALADLAKLNARLEGVVSELPPRLARPPEAAGGEGAEDEESEDEDPTELYHRDVGTQTASSPPRSSADSDDSSDAPSTPREATPTTTKTTAHTTALRAIHAHLSELLTEDCSVAVADESVRDRIADLQAYLDGLAYASPSYGNGGAGGVYGMYGNGSGSGGGGGGWGWSSGKGGGGGEEDGIARVKAEIRGVKGVLLSARNFPGRTRGSGMGRVGGGDGAAPRNSTVV